MDVTVGGPPISVSVVVVDPTASVSRITPEAAISYAVPITALAYIEIVSSAYMDDSGRYQYRTDTFAVVDQTALSTSKSITGDSFSFDDAVSLTPAPTYSDSISFSDVLVPVLIFLRDFAETLTVPDAKALLVSPAYVESVAPTDTMAFSHSKALTDSFALNDLSDANGPDWSFSDYTNNTVSTSDSTVIGQDKGFSDSLSLADSGTLISQGYCDLTYFAEDYVGYNFTF